MSEPEEIFDLLCENRHFEIGRKPVKWFENLDAMLAERLPELQIVCEEPMSRHTSFAVGGPAKRMAFPHGSEQMVRLMEIAAACGLRPLVIGKGSNLLTADEGLDCLVIDTSRAMMKIEEVGTGVLRAEAGASLAQLAVFAQQRGLTGLEFAHGIPGTVGGAMCMNAGAYDGEMKQVVRSVTVLQPGAGVRTLTNTEMAFGYRRSILTDHPDWVVLSVEVALQSGEPEQIWARMTELMDRRRTSQPLEFHSAGSTFKRPAGYYAGALIDQCGLKGFTVGGAQVSEKHAGFVINRGGATCADILAVIRQVQARVKEETGVDLEPEVKIVGCDC